MNLVSIHDYTFDLDNVLFFEKDSIEMYPILRIVFKKDLGNNLEIRFGDIREREEVLIYLIETY